MLARSLVVQSILRIPCLLLLLGAVTLAPGTGQAITPFWTVEIDSGLVRRDGFYDSILQEHAAIPLISFDKKRAADIFVRLGPSPDSTNLWQTFFRGILDTGTGGAPEYFARALDLSAHDVGSTWALFVEFMRNNQPGWADKCLNNIEKQLIESGGVSAPVIGQQLLLYGVENEKSRDFGAAERYFSWAQRFDGNEPWALLHRMRMNLPGNPVKSLFLFFELVKLARNSWPLQLSCAEQAYTWLRYVLLSFLLVVLIGIGLRHFPAAVHQFADRLPESIPPTLKTMLIAALVAAFLSFGLLPFIWLVAFLVLPCLEKKERPLIWMAMAFVVFSPLDARIQEMFRQVKDPRSSVEIFLRASEEGYSPSLHAAALEKINDRYSDWLAHLAVSLCAMKEGNLAAARFSANSALSLKPDDPEVIFNAGNAAFVAGDYESAVFYYRKILSRQPAHPQAFFNLSQCFALESDTVNDFSFIRVFPSKDQRTINDFVTTNTACFGKNWPLSRQIMPATIHPQYFWLHLFPAYGGSWITTRKIWGGAFFGAGPRLSLLLFIMLSGILLFFQLGRLNPVRRRKIAHCLLCKRLICDECRRGELCHTCFHATAAVEEEGAVAEAKTRIAQQHETKISITASVLDICLPGSGMLFASTYRMAIMVALLTGVVYGSCMYLLNMHLSYPLWAAYMNTEHAVLFFPVYNAIFAGRMLFATMRNRKTTPA